MTEAEQFDVINKPGYLPALLAKVGDTLATLSSKQLSVDSVAFLVSGVPNTLYMPKGGVVARLDIGRKDDSTPIIEIPQVPVGWVTPS